MGLGIGASLGLLGGGGSILTVPALVYGAGVPVQAAVPLSLGVVGATSAAGAFFKQRSSLVHGRAALLFGATGIVGAVAGAKLTHFVKPAVLLLIFAALMLAIGVRMLLAREATEHPAAKQCRPWRCGGAGLGVGLLTGFLGVGGGFLIVPAMQHFGRLPLPIATGTSLVVIAVNSFAGLVGHLCEARINWSVGGWFLAAALLGMFVAVRLADRIPRATLSRGFGAFVLVTAAFVITKNWNAIQ